MKQKLNSLAARQIHRTRIKWREDATPDADWDYGYDPICDCKERRMLINCQLAACSFPQSHSFTVPGIQRIQRVLRRGALCRRLNGCKLNLRQKGRRSVCVLSYGKKKGITFAPTFFWEIVCLLAY